MFFYKSGGFVKGNVNDGQMLLRKPMGMKPDIDFENLP